MIRVIPQIITHNYDPDHGAFGNICDLPDSEAEHILGALRVSGKRRLKPDYLKRRRATEQWLRSERTRKLGPSRLNRPVYFFLGDFADGLDPSRPLSVRLALSAFSPDMLTFTYGDSMSSLPIATRLEHVAIRKAYHGQVFTLDEIKNVVAAFGMPDKHAPSPDRFIEVQIWDDEPIRRLVNNQIDERSSLSVQTIIDAETDNIDRSV